jgi:hypothetical protein
MTPRLTGRLTVGRKMTLILITTFVKKQLVKKEEGKKENKRKTTVQIGTIVKVRVFNAGLLARSQFASGQSCNRPT